MIPKPFLDTINIFFAKKEAWEQGIGKRVYIFGLGYECIGIVGAWYKEGCFRKYDITYKPRYQDKECFGSFFANQIYFLDDSESNFGVV